MFQGFFFFSDAPMAIASTYARYSGNNGPFLKLVDSAWWPTMVPIAQICNIAAQIYLILSAKKPLVTVIAIGWAAIDIFMYIPFFVFKNKAVYYLEQDDLTKSYAEA